MEGQGPIRQNERDSTPPANAITPDTDAQTIANMIVAELEGLGLSDETPVKASTNEKKIEESVSTASKAAVADARIIRAKLHDFNVSHSPAAKASTIEEKIEETVSTAFRASMANFIHKPVVDVTALRVQTLGSFPHSPTFRTRAYTDRPHSQHRVPLQLDDRPERPDSPKANLLGPEARHHCRQTSTLFRVRGPY
jgi:hypothetical protein